MTQIIQTVVRAARTSSGFRRHTATAVEASPGHDAIGVSEGDGAALRVGYKGIAPALAAATNSASTRT